MLDKFAKDLKDLRESKNITLDEVYEKTKIHISKLEKMESGDFSFYLPVHIRAFLRQYAVAIRENPDDILYNFELAKAGKYKPKSQIKEENQPEKNIKPNKKETEDISQEIEFERNDNNGDNIKQEEQDRKSYSKSKKVKIKTDKGDFEGKGVKETSFGIPISYLKNAGVILLLIILVFAIYMLIKVILDNKEEKPEITKQKFEDVVKEQEKKILGKRSEEEIRDSIKTAELKADSIKKAKSDSLFITIKSTDKGSFTIYYDTLLERAKHKEEFVAGESGEFKAKDCFYISSNNTKAFQIYLNGKLLKINEEKADKLKITRQGIVQKK